MFKKVLVFFVFCAVFVNGKLYKIPDGFNLGLATAAYQVEGGWNASGKGQNIWDNITHVYPDFTPDHSNGDIACDSYHKWEEDVEILKRLGANHYRFSISWSRILPTGFPNEINPDGIRYYNDLINELLRNNIEPMATIFHFDTPQPLQDLGGLTNLNFAQYAEDYARVLFKYFGDRVKWWITFNEPITYCDYGYNGFFAPAVLSDGIGTYLCGKTILVGHGKIFRMYEKEFKEKQGGKVGITINSFWLQPKTSSQADIEATNQALEFMFGWWMNPIFSKEGNYPKVMIDRIAYVSKAQNFSESRLPALTKEEIKLIRGAFDFLGLNYYTSKLVRALKKSPYNPPSFQQDVGVGIEKIPGAEQSEADWLQVYPKGIRYLLKYIKKKYDNPDVVITENGYPDDNGKLCDPRRINYIQKHLIEIIKAIHEECKVIGYTYWSLMDNFEWRSGYTEKYGVVQIDFDSPNRTRTLKASAEFFRFVTEHRVVPSNYINL